VLEKTAFDRILWGWWGQAGCDWWDM